VGDETTGKIEQLTDEGQKPNDLNLSVNDELREENEELRELLRECRELLKYREDCYIDAGEACSRCSTEQMVELRKQIDNQLGGEDE
jgi:hypothetical protein